MFGNVVGDDGGNGCGKGQQKEEFGQFVVIFCYQCINVGEKIDVVGDVIVDEKVGYGGYVEIG